MTEYSKYIYRALSLSLYIYIYIYTQICRNIMLELATPKITPNSPMVSSFNASWTAIFWIHSLRCLQEVIQFAHWHVVHHSIWRCCFFGGKVIRQVVSKVWWPCRFFAILVKLRVPAQTSHQNKIAQISYDYSKDTASKISVSSAWHLSLAGMLFWSFHVPVLGIPLIVCAPPRPKCLPFGSTLSLRSLSVS